MNTRPSRIGRLALGLFALAALALGLNLFPTNALAALDCSSTTHDEDLDGIPDKHECDGINFLEIPVLRCTGSPSPGIARNSCLDPSSKDIFVVLVKPVGDSIILRITDPFLFLYQPRKPPLNSTSTSIIDGLGLGVHVATVDRLLDASAKTLVPGLPQRAIQITESLNPDSPISGQMNLYGTPTFCVGEGCVQPGDGVVYTQRIRRQVNSVYFPGCPVAELLTNPQCDKPEVWSLFIQRTLAHEISHALALKATYDKRNGGNHDPDSTNVIMQQNVTYSGSGATAVFNIGVDYASSDNNCERKIQVDRKGTAICIPF